MLKIWKVLFGLVVVGIVFQSKMLVSGEISYGKIKISYDKTAEISINYGDVVVVKHIYYYFRDSEGTINLSIPSYRGFEEPVVEKILDNAGNETGMSVLWKVTTGPNRMPGLSEKDEQYVKLSLKKDEVSFEINLIPTNPNSKGYGEIGFLIPEDTFAGGSYKGVYVSGSGQETTRTGDIPVERETVQPNTKVFKIIEMKTGEKATGKFLMRAGVKNYKKLILQDFRSYETAPWAGNWRLAAGMDNPLGKDYITIEFEEE
ncbi:MAG: hypothetical protein NC905_02990 [Candidatus Omnitrophica bacterium]|nr:hypothetical protein [Candidatus Omnitrophota bacterium]MCM8777214.1 hypothetical protein [Candidatus Omnitrophota bacterium]